MDFSARMCPVSRANLFTEADYYVWCGAMFKFREAYYLIYSRWEKKLGFEAWATDSWVCLAKADSMIGEFTHLRELFDYRGQTPEERKVIHNPTVCPRRTTGAGVAVQAHPKIRKCFVARSIDKAGGG